jgi:Flp pilus assembly protein TadB
MIIEDYIKKIKELVVKEKATAREVTSLLNSSKPNDSPQEKKMIDNQVGKLKIILKNTNDELLKNLEALNIKNPLTKLTIEPVKSKTHKISQGEINFIERREKITRLEKDVIKRIREEKIKGEKKEEKKSTEFRELAEKTCSNLAKSLIKKKIFTQLGADIVKSNLNYNLISYVSLILFSTVIAFGGAIVLFILLLFFNISPNLPIITLVENIGLRFLQIFWIPIIIPIGVFIFAYIYPMMEKKSIEGKIDAELPFAVIHMAAISGSMINPIKIFSIISSTREYPNLEKEFNKLLNEINVYGYDLVSALKELAINSPSQKLGELFNGLATTITSGGNMYDFFDKRAQTLLFDYKLDKEKRTKSAETFMDIYISIVIAAPMILMLLLMMMKISGLGISLSTSMITLLVVGGVSLINIFFLAFLQIKQQATG